ncbi:MAG: hypothetical protein AB7T10_06835 [bacterium]
MKKNILLTIILVLLILTNSCTIIGPFYFERYLGHNSICWEDNDHILIYASIGEYYYTSEPIGGMHKNYDWGGGEIWRITASTGAKELLFRSKDGYSIDNARIYIANEHVYISGASTAKIREDFSGWDKVGDFIYPIVSPDERYIIGVETSDLKTIKQYDESDSTENVLYVNDELVTWLDYDYAHNYLLINSNKFVDLNTGEETLVVEYGDRIEQYIVTGDAINGEIMDNYIAMDMALRDTITDVRYVGKLKVNIEDNTIKELNEKAYGFISPDGIKYASGYPHSVLITDTLGEWINNIEFEGDEL